MNMNLFGDSQSQVRWHSHDGPLFEVSGESKPIVSLALVPVLFFDGNLVGPVRFVLREDGLTGLHRMSSHTKRILNWRVNGLTSRSDGSNNMPTVAHYQPLWHVVHHLVRMVSLFSTPLVGSRCRIDMGISDNLFRPPGTGSPEQYTWINIRVGKWLFKEVKTFYISQ